MSTDLTALDKIKPCPRCKSSNYSRERSPTGRTYCLDCDESMLSSDWDLVGVQVELLKIKKLEAQNKKLRSVLVNIANYETLLDGEKYLNYEQGWHGVAEYARQCLKEIEGRDE